MKREPDEESIVREPMVSPPAKFRNGDGRAESYFLRSDLGLLASRSLGRIASLGSGFGTLAGWA